MKTIKYTLIVLMALLFTNQISVGVVDSQKYSAPPAAANEGLYSVGWTGGHFVTGVDQVIFNVVDTSEFVEIAVGNNHALGIKTNGTLWAWGSQANGKLGDGVNNVNGYVLKPLQIGVDTNWSKISAGDNHSAAIKTTGTLWTWGAAGNGQLGNGTTTPTITAPTQIGSDTNWSDVSCGLTWTAAVKGGDLVTTGNNNSFRTGLNTSTGNTLSFTVANSGGWTKCFAGNQHGIGFKDDELWSWGGNVTGRTGQGTISGSTQVPAQTTNVTTGWLTASAGNQHSMAIKTDGTIHYFGNQLNGRLGNGLTGSASITSVTQLGSDTDWEDVRINGNSLTAGQNEMSYAIKGGSLYATGLNNIGQLGLDPAVTAETGTWTQVGTATNCTRVGAGGGFALVIRKDP
jgi:alpha-tubulin suppressor-like RCC1 family protein